MRAEPTSDGLLRCNGTLVIHLDGETECTEPHCVDRDPLGHRLTLDCVNIDGGCVCADTEPTIEIDTLVS